MVTEHSPIHWDYRPELKRPVFIAGFEGWNDGGQAASNTIRRLVDMLGAERFARMDPEAFYVFTENRPHVRLVDGLFRKIDWQVNDFYHARLPDADRDVILFLGTEPNLMWRAYCSHLLDVAAELQTEFLITLGGFLADTLYTLPVQVNGFSNEREFEERFNLQRTNYEGPTGIVGVLSSISAARDMPTLSLWAAVPYYISIPNPKAVYALISKLTEIYRFSVDLGPLEADSNSFDNEINDIVAKDPNVAAYVRELKKREFLN